MQEQTNDETLAVSASAPAAGYVPTNREKSRRASKSKFWCGYCDAALVGDYGKCPNCGRKQNPKKVKGT